MIGQWSGIACFVLPGLEVHDLRPADAEYDLKDFQAGGFLRHPRIQAGAALLDKSKVKSGREGYRLDVIARIIWVVTTQVAVVSRNRGVETRSQTRNCVREGCTEIGIGRAAVTGPPTGIHCELGEICQAGLSAGARRRAARQGAKCIQINAFFALRVEVCIEEINVALLIVRIIGDILWLVSIEDFKGTYVAGRRGVDSAKFGVLLPKICFNNLGGGEESQDVRVSGLDLTLIGTGFSRCSDEGSAGPQKGGA